MMCRLMKQLKTLSNYINFNRGLFLFAIFTGFTLSANADWKNSDFIVDNICYRVTNRQSTVAVTYDWCYINDGTGSTRYTGPYEGDITIPEFVTDNSVTYKVTAIDAHAFEGRSSVTSVSLPNTIISIGEYAFCNCSGLMSITLPQNITSIGNGAFSGCERLTSFNIPNSVTNIGQSAFSGTGWYNAQPNGILYLDNWLIGYKGDRPTGVITIKSGTKGLAENVFWYSTGLTSVIIPSSVTFIGKYAFDDCSGLTSVHISDIAAWCKISFGNSKSNPLYYAHHLYLGEDEITDLEIPNSVTKIGDDAFYGCSDLMSVTIPKSVTSIGGRSFAGCSGLTSVTIPQSVTSIEVGAFFGCSGLTSVIIPSSVTDIDGYAFNGCTSLTSVIVAKKTPIPIYYSDTFSNRANATLYVPYGCKAAYEAAGYWKEFKEILELDPEISQLDNAIYIDPFTISVGNKVQMDICLKNAEAATAYVFDLVLPEGITVAKNSNEKYIDELSDRHDDHTRTFNYKGENTYGLSTLSGNSEQLTGNDGPIRLVTIEASDNMAEGNYAIDIKNASYSKPDGTLVSLPDTRAIVTVEDYVLGDVNGNGGVDIGDAVSIVNYLVGKDSSNFVAKAADTNKNGQIDIGDAVTIVNLLVGKITHFTREFNLIWDEKEPE